MIELLLAVLPIVLLLVLMAILRIPAIKAMPITWIVTTISGLFFWKMGAIVIAAATAKGAIIAFEILLIVVGAIFLLEILKGAGFIKKIDSLLRYISHDKRIDIIIIAWSFSAFIEGAAGFGTPAALAAPLLVGLGITPIIAVIVALIANSTPVSFGAIGTPVVIGIGTSVKESSAQMLQQVSLYTALIHALIGLFIPLVVVCVYTKLSKDKSFRKGLEVWPFALFAGACFVVPYFLIALVGPEFPSLVGGIIGFLLVLIGSRYFIPKKLKTKHPKPYLWKMLKALSPYFVVALLLFITRLSNVKSLLSVASIKFNDLFGTGVSYTFSPLLNPGIILLFVAAVAMIFLKESKYSIEKAIEKTSSKAIYTFIALLFAVSLVQLFLVSGNNLSGLPSMPIVIADWLSGVTGKAFVFFSPFIGVLGSFISGSNTVSNLLMTPSQYAAAIRLGLPLVVILALQNIGGAIGNMIATHNIIAASATVGIKGEEGKIISTNILPSLIYALIAGVLAFIIIGFFL